MNYELAKKLKDAGFPQPFIEILTKLAEIDRTELKEIIKEVQLELLPPPDPKCVICDNYTKQMEKKEDRLAKRFGIREFGFLWFGTTLKEFVKEAKRVKGFTNSPLMHSIASKIIELDKRRKHDKRKKSVH